MKTLRAIWNFKFRNTMLFLVGATLFIIGSLAYNSSGEEQEGVFAQFQGPLLWAMPIGIGVCIYAVVSGFSRLGKRSSNAAGRPLEANSHRSGNSEPFTPSAPTQPVANKPGQNLIISGVILLIFGVLLAVYPLVSAALNSTGADAQAEETGMAVLMLILTVPAGGALGIVGLVMAIIGAKRAATISK
jgi:uncharacterized membrane protein HdeD (DUF308 family)